MMYMVVSLATVVLGLMFAYVFFNVEPQMGKTLNAVLFDKVIGGWGMPGYLLILLTLISEAAILFVAAQAGFIDGPRVLANMAADRWAPKRFALLSDRLVTMNGIMIMGIGSIILMIATNGSVGYMIVLYSINVFITFCLSQLGMVKHWWQVRSEVKKWFRKFAINGIGLAMTSFILISVTVVKFQEGGWITLVITGTLIVFMLLVKLSYQRVDGLIKDLNGIVEEVEYTQPVSQIPVNREKDKPFDLKDKTAVVIVKDFTGVGIETIFQIFRSFERDFKNFIFIQVGLIDAAAFRGTAELESVKKKVESELGRYVNLVRRHGYHSEGVTLFGIDTAEQIEKYIPELLKNYPNATFFGGQIIFPRLAIFSRLLHNHTLFAIQKKLFRKGIRLYVLPVELKASRQKPGF